MLKFARNTRASKTLIGISNKIFMLNLRLFQSTMTSHSRYAHIVLICALFTFILRSHRSLYAHIVLTLRSIYVHFTFTYRSLYAYFMFILRSLMIQHSDYSGLHFFYDSKFFPSCEYIDRTQIGDVFFRAKMASLAGSVGIFPIK